MKNSVCWIDVIGEDNADAKLKTIYGDVRSADGSLDNLYQAFSLRAHTIKPADDLYLAVLHNEGNCLPKWFAELIGTYVAMLTGCRYALTHHGHNFHRLLDDPARSNQILGSLGNGNLEDCGNEREVVALRYARKLCLEPATMAADDVETLSEVGWSDGEVLEIVQITAMFSYFVRVINGLGIAVEDGRDTPEPGQPARRS